MGKWLNQELKILEKYYSIKTVKEVQMKLSQEGFFRKISHITTKASRLGIKGKRVWLEWEDYILVTCYPEERAVGCKLYLPHRTISSIHKRARRLKVKAKNPISLKDRYGKLEVLCGTVPHIDSKKGTKRAQVICLCDCGKYTIARENSLKSGQKVSCGNCNPIILGKRYNKWIEPLERLKDDIDPKSKKHFKRFRVKCHYNGKGCLGEFDTRANSIKNGHTGSCGCLNREKIKQRMTKENNPNYKGGITTLIEQIRDLPEYIEWRELVFKRDSYICQYSGIEGHGDLNAHHIKPLYVIIEENNITTIEQARRCKELWNVSNGVTLLNIYHLANKNYPQAFHSIYGTVNFTEEDYYIWVEERRFYENCN